MSTTLRYCNYEYMVDELDESHYWCRPGRAGDGTRECRGCVKLYGTTGEEERSVNEGSGSGVHKDREDDVCLLCHGICRRKWRAFCYHGIGRCWDDSLWFSESPTVVAEVLCKGVVEWRIKHEWSRRDAWGCKLDSSSFKKNRCDGRRYNGWRVILSATDANVFSTGRTFHLKPV